METIETNLLTPDKISDIPKTYPFVGEGAQGTVFRYAADKCIKIFKNEKIAKAEIQAYKKVEVSPLFAKLYESGENYIIIEYINGPSLHKYLKTQGTITKPITAKILAMFTEMGRLGFTDIDASLRHIIITENNDLKLIDLAHSYTLNNYKPWRLFSGLKRLNCLTAFLDHVKELDKEVYTGWMNRFPKLMKKGNG